MAGWICKDGVNMRWDGTLNANSFEGDGSKLSGITGGSGGGTLWASAAEVIYPISSNQTISGAGLVTNVVSGAYLVSSGDVSGVYIWGDGSKLTGIAAGGGANLWASSAEMIYPLSVNQTISGAGLAVAGTVSGTNVYCSGAMGVGTVLPSYALHVRSYNPYLTVDATLNNRQIKINPGNGAIDAVNTALHFNRFSALDMAVGYGSDSRFRIGQAPPFNPTSMFYIGSKTAGTVPFKIQVPNTQSVDIMSVYASGGAVIEPLFTIDKDGLTGIGVTAPSVKLEVSGSILASSAIINQVTVGSGAITLDGDELSGARLQNIVIGTGGTPPTASNFPRGTIYVQYTP